MLLLHELDSHAEELGTGLKTNISTLKTWMACPLQARFKEIERRPWKQNAKASFGVCIHEALEGYNIHGDVERAIDRFKETWHDPDILDVAPETWPKYTDYGKLRAKGIDILKLYDEKNKWENRRIIGQEHRFCVPIGDHQISGIVDLVESKKSGRGARSLRIVEYKTNSKAPTNMQLRMDIQFCVDTETEILTRRGWKSYAELLVGEDVLTYDQSTGWAEWQPAREVYQFEAIDQEMVSLEGKAHSSLTTKNHRWPVSHVVSGRNGWREEPRVVVSEDLTDADRILCAAPVKDLPLSNGYSDSMVELVAWFAAERTAWHNMSLSLAQSPRVNPVYVERIESVLDSLFTCEESLRNLAYPAWRVSHDADCNRYYLNRTASSEVCRFFSDTTNKVVDVTWLSQLTEQQLRLFVETFVDADGHRSNDRVEIVQSVKERLDVLQVAYSLLGVRTSLRRIKVGGRTFWSLAVKQNESRFAPKTDTRTIERYTGVVWCPVTDNSTWFARRSGHVYFTGNTAYVYASLQPEFWMGNPEATKESSQTYAALPDGEMFWESFQGVDRRAVWYDLWNNKEKDAGPRDDDDFLRLYRCIVEVNNAIEKGVYVPSISGDTCTFCDYTDICTAVKPIRDRMDLKIGEDPEDEGMF